MSLKLHSPIIRENVANAHERLEAAVKSVFFSQSALGDDLADGLDLTARKSFFVISSGIRSANHSPGPMVT
jgi:hypothetical protein